MWPRPARRQAGQIGNLSIVRGFSLLETLVAVAIFSIAIVALIEAIAGNTRMQSWYESQGRAVALAQNVLEEIEYVGNLQVGTDGGDFDGTYTGYSWSSEILDCDTPNLCEVHVTITWTEGEARRDYQLVTYLRKNDSETSVGLATAQY